MPDRDEELEEGLQRSMSEPAKKGASNTTGLLSWPRTYKARFILPGLAKYEDQALKTLFIPKEALDQFSQSFVGRPVINEIHKEVSPDRFEDQADGVVTRVWFEPMDGWYWCEFIVWDELTKFNCESEAYSVSCAYNITSYTPEGGEHNSVPYDHMVLDGEYTHLAIVANPRYEGARIIYNSKGGNAMWFKFWNSKKTEAVKADMEKTMVEVDGQMVALNSLVTAHKEIMSGSVKVENMTDDTIVELDGEELPMRDLKNAYRAKMKAKNEADDKDKKDKEKDEAKNKEDDEEKKKKDEEAKNAADMEKDHKDGKHDEKAENCASCKNADEEKKKKDDEDKKSAENARKHFDDLKKRAENRDPQLVHGDAQRPTLMSRKERAAEGAKRYGSPKAA